MFNLHAQMPCIAFGADASPRNMVTGLPGRTLADLGAIFAIVAFETGLVALPASPAWLTRTVAGNWVTVSTVFTLADF